MSCHVLASGGLPCCDAWTDRLLQPSEYTTPRHRRCRSTLGPETGPRPETDPVFGWLSQEGHLSASLRSQKEVDEISYEVTMTSFLEVCFCSLMTNPWGSLSTPTPAPLTAAMVSQYRRPGLRVEISRSCWPLFTVQFWYCCSSESTHHTWAEEQAP